MKDKGLSPALNLYTLNLHLLKTHRAPYTWHLTPNTCFTRMIGLLATATAYLLGSIPFGYLIVRWQRGIDVRETGSRSVGATNVMRNLGISGFIATFVLDCGKGSAAVMLASRLTGNDPRWVAAAAVAAVAGHVFPIWLGFRGGKGVATGVGVFAILAPVPMALVLVFFCAACGDLALYLPGLDYRHGVVPRLGVPAEPPSHADYHWRCMRGGPDRRQPPRQHPPAAKRYGEEAGRKA